MSSLPDKLQDNHWSTQTVCIITATQHVIIAKQRSYRLWLRPTQKRRTSVQPEGKNATWNESFHLPVDIVTRQKLVVVLLDHDTIGSDDELGR